MKMKFLAVFLAFSSPVMAADSAPQCNLSTSGQVACMADRMCECKHYHASLMKGTPEGYRWDCGITRPACLDYKQIDNSNPYDGPESLDLGDDNKIKTEINN